jgi:hypothetical protein
MQGFQSHRRVPLEGIELEEFLLHRAEEQQRKLEKSKEIESTQDESDYPESEAESILFQTAPRIFNPFERSYDWIPGKNETFFRSSSALFPRTKELHGELYSAPPPLFPQEDVRHKWDDYGQAIDLNHFIKPPAHRDLNADSLVSTSLVVPHVDYLLLERAWS